MGGRFLLVKRWLPGQVLEPFPSELLRSAGAALARLHRVAADGFEVTPHARRLSETQVEQIATFADQSFANWLKATLARVADEGSDDMGELTLCHGDLFADNVVVDGDHVTLIDWETLTLDDPILDLGMSVVGLVRLGHELPKARLELLIEGYNAVRSLAPAQLERLPTQILHAAAIIGFHRYYRHVVRFPDPARVQYHREMQEFATGMPSC